MPHPWDGKWTTGEEIGKGGQGFTHSATNVETPSVQGVLKRLKNRKSEQARARMRREVVNLQSLATLTHSVPRVLDHNTDEFEDKNVELFVVMDYIDGPTLKQYVDDRGPLTVDESVSFTKSLCKTLDIAHQAETQHRDLKPDNIIVRDSGSFDLVVIDYGLSFNVDDEPVTETEETFRNKFLTLPETVAPGDNKRDPRSDLTALCAVFYFCLTGKSPGSLQDGNGTAPHLRQGYSISEAQGDDERLSILNDFLTVAFAPDIANRFQSIEQITERLSVVVQHNYDAGDPIQLGAVLTAKLRVSDRKSQIALFRDGAKDLFEFIYREVMDYRGELGMFDVVDGGGLHPQVPSTLKVPAGLDLVGYAPRVIVVSVAEYTFQKHIRYAVASKGDQCVLLVTTNHLKDPSDRRGITDAYDWKEVAWYDGDPESIHSLVSLSFRELLTTQMLDLARAIEGQVEQEPG